MKATHTLLLLLCLAGCSAIREPVELNDSLRLARSEGRNYVVNADRRQQISDGVSQLKKGMTRSEVERILGQPDRCVPIYEPIPMFSFIKGRQVGLSLEYWVHWTVASEKRWLELRFDEQNCVKAWRGNLSGMFFEIK